MLNSDVPALERILDDELTFTTHLGDVITKTDDLSMHESGFISISEIRLSDMKIVIRETYAIVSVKVFISGRFGESASEGSFRFTRIWTQKENGSWNVLSGHSCIVSN